ncbi:MAG: hypothetical protein HY205_04070, partial [Nitrospirae bacterium]|nr:hypothetical protein [Nitrospirota bacterium]
ARKKFLKSAATEFSHICQVVQQAALAWPSVQFRLKHNGQEVFDYAAVASSRDRLLQVYGMKVMAHMVEVLAERPGLRLEGVTVDAAQTRAGRTPQELFVNRRAVKNATIAHAVSDGYGSFLAKGRYPRYVLFLDVDPERVDVNVHPTKREVRFADQDLIHQTVRRAIRGALGGQVSAPMDGLAAGSMAEASSGLAGSHEAWAGADRPAGWPGGEGRSSLSMPPRSDYDWARGARQMALSQGTTGGSSSADPAEAPGLCEPMQTYRPGVGSEVVPLGQVSRTFLIAQVGSELQVIDQHTAHERVLFERLWRAWLTQGVASQPLLIAEPVELPPHGAALLQRYVSDLEKLGLVIEPFGASAFVIRAVPALLGHLDYPALLQDLLDDLSEWNAASSLDLRVRPVLASLACHSAVRAGRAMDLAESKQLIEDWVEEGLPMTCPHGRRVALRFPADELAKIFGRA